MHTATLDTQALAARFERLERQNRRTGTFCLALLFLPVLALIACQSRATQVVEAQKFVLRDKSGKVRVEIAMMYDTGPNGHPVFRLLDEDGKERTTVGAGILTISGEQGTNAVLLDDKLQFANSAGVTADLGGKPGGGGLWLFGENAKSIFLNSDSPVVELSDSNGFRADLGSNEQVTPRTGEKQTTSAASLVLSGKNGVIIWHAP